MQERQLLVEKLLYYYKRAEFFAADAQLKGVTDERRMKLQRDAAINVAIALQCGIKSISLQRQHAQREQWLLAEVAETAEMYTDSNNNVAALTRTDLLGFAPLTHLDAAECATAEQLQLLQEAKEKLMDAKELYKQLRPDLVAECDLSLAHSGSADALLSSFDTVYHLPSSITAGSNVEDTVRRSTTPSVWHMHVAVRRVQMKR